MGVSETETEEMGVDLTSAAGTRGENVPFPR